LPGNAPVKSKPLLFLLPVESPQLVETLDKNNQSPLHRAAWLGRRQVCERLLEAGAVIGRTDSKVRRGVGFVCVCRIEMMDFSELGHKQPHV